MPLDETEPSPIVFLDDTGTVEDLPDVAFAVRGLAADAELRPIQLKHATGEEFFRLAERSVASVRVDSDAPPCAFLLRKGAT
jgi:L-fucose mutarotase